MKKIGFLILALCAGSTYAQTIISDRPTKTNSSTVIPISSLQVETGASVAFTPNGTKANSRIIAPTSLFRYGVSDFFEIRMLTQFESFKAPLDLNRTSGIADFQFGTKIRLLDNDEETTKVAWIGHMSIPTGSRGISSELYSGISSLAISHVLAENINFSYNLGFNYYPTKNGDITYSAALGVAVNDKVSFFIEPYGQYTRLQTYEASFDAGLTYLLKSNVQMDFSYGSGLNHKMNFLSIGFSWNTAKKVD
ncbi:MAG: hypothetical protein ACJA0Q_001146 [Saprospiraceae bacterium]|jgi:hypothetical protein